MIYSFPQLFSIGSSILHNGNVFKTMDGKDFIGMEIILVEILFIIWGFLSPSDKSKRPYCLAQI